MQRLLFISSLRSVKSNALRYGALMLTVALSMLLVIGTLASALDVINSVESSNAAHHQEDGEFGTFVPLTDSEVAKLEDRGLTIEAQPYLDFSQEDGSTLRVMANREQINQVVVHEGALAAFENEIAIETLYAKAKGLAVGDSVQVSGKTCMVSGIVSSPDYDFCVPNLSSTVADAREFGTAFTTADTYNDLRADGQAIRSEAYRYAFLLPSDLTAADVKKQLEEFDVDPAAVDDVYFHELVDRTLQDRTDKVSMNWLRAVQAFLREPLHCAKRSIILMKHSLRSVRLRHVLRRGSINCLPAQIRLKQVQLKYLAHCSSSMLAQHSWRRGRRHSARRQVFRVRLLRH